MRHGHDLEQRRLIDTEITRRSIGFMTRCVQAGSPFYAYVPFTQVHFPTLPSPAFAGKTGYGDFADALAEMDAHVGELLDAIDHLRDWWSHPIRLGTPKAFNLITDPKEEYPAAGVPSTWIVGPMMAIVATFEQSLTDHPPMAPGTPDPYTPPA